MVLFEYRESRLTIPLLGESPPDEAPYSMIGIFEHAFWPLELVRGAEAQYIAEAEVQTPDCSAVDNFSKDHPTDRKSSDELHSSFSSLTDVPCTKQDILLCFSTSSFVRPRDTEQKHPDRPDPLCLFLWLALEHFHHSHFLAGSRPTTCGA